MRQELQYDRMMRELKGLKNVKEVGAQGRFPLNVFQNIKIWKVLGKLVQIIRSETE